jgi:hypothetical protein
LKRFRDAYALKLEEDTVLINAKWAELTENMDKLILLMQPLKKSLTHTLRKCLQSVLDAFEEAGGSLSDFSVEDGDAALLTALPTATDTATDTAWTNVGMIAIASAFNGGDTPMGAGGGSGPAAPSSHTAQLARATGKQPAPPPPAQPAPKKANVPLPPSLPFPARSSSPRWRNPRVVTSPILSCNASKNSGDARCSALSSNCSRLD